METTSPYRAFISYNRADAAIALALATSLKRFARPWYRTRAMRVFLDKTSLATDPTLSGAIDRGLAQSEWMVLIASPSSAASPWVRHEIEWWLAHRDVAKLIVARVAGVIAWQGADGTDFDWSVNTALSPVLRGRFPVEPIWADLEAAAAAPRLSVDEPAFRDGFLLIAAPIHGVPKDELWSTERSEQRKRIALAAAAVLAIGVVARVGYNQHAVAMDRKENLASIQLGAKAFLLLPSDPQLAARVALAGLALRPSGIALSALRHTLARIDAAVPPRVEVDVPGAIGLAYSPDAHASQLAVLVADGQVTVLETASGRALHRLVPPAPTRAHAVAWGAEGLLAVGSDEGLMLWRLAGPHDDAAPLAPRRLALPAVRVLAFSPDGRHIALGHADGSVRMVDLRSDRTTRLFRAHAGGVRAIAFDNDGGRLATGGENGEVALWDAESTAPILVFRMPRPIASVDFNRHGGSVVANQMLAASDTSGATRVVSAETAEPPDEPASPARSTDFGPGLGVGVAARLLDSGQCLARVQATGPVAVVDTMGFGPLFAIARGGGGAPPVIAVDVAQTRLFALLDAAGHVALYEQPLCGDAEAVCGFGQTRLVGAISTQDRTRWISEDIEVNAAVQQSPGPVCRQLIDRLIPQTQARE